MAYQIYGFGGGQISSEKRLESILRRPPFLGGLPFYESADLSRLFSIYLVELSIYMDPISVCLFGREETWKSIEFTLLTAAEILETADLPWSDTIILSICLSDPKFLIANLSGSGLNLPGFFNGEVPYLSNLITFYSSYLFSVSASGKFVNFTCEGDSCS